jgi:hypothetical protein
MQNVVLVYLWGFSELLYVIMGNNMKGNIGVNRANKCLEAKK